MLKMGINSSYITIRRWYGKKHLTLDDDQGKGLLLIFHNVKTSVLALHSGLDFAYPVLRLVLVLQEQERLVE